MLIAPDIDPVAISLGPLKVHWYGLMYLVGFVGGWWLAVRQAKRPNSGWKPEEISDLLFNIILGVILGGRLGYVLFYNLPHYLDHPLEIFYLWTGGMSFHGGLIGVILAMWYFGRKTQRAFFTVADFIAPVTPLGLGAGRLGNFINQELWGSVTTVPWGMVFKTGGPLPRHPSQLYEFALEGVVLFLILWLYARKAAPDRGDVRPVPGLLRRVPVSGRIRARARRAARLSRLRLGDDGADSQSADDPVRRMAYVVGLQEEPRGYLIHTVLAFTNSRMPWTTSSRP